jgi:hypothetical protein
MEMKDLIVSLRSWQTSLVGLVIIVVASAAMKYLGLDPVVGSSLVLAGLGLILARDGGKTSEQVGLLPPAGKTIVVQPVDESGVTVDTTIKEDGK